MPELPDVEIFKQYFRATALQQEIDGVEILSPELLSGGSEKCLQDLLCGRSFTEVARYGKYLFAAADGRGWLVLHFGMTGFLRYFKKENQSPKHLRLLVSFANGYRLAYDCQRKLGQIGWCIDRARFIRDKRLGPDPLDERFDREAFGEILENRRGAIKSLLMNQQALCGIGNVYSDEILFHADVHPRRKVADLTQDERTNLYARLKDVLHTAIECRVGEKGWPDSWLLPHREVAEACPRCGGEILRLKVSGRSTYCCEKHQQ